MLRLTIECLKTKSIHLFIFFFQFLRETNNYRAYKIQ